MRAQLVVLLIALGCVPIDAEDCAKRKTEDSCNDADVDVGECHWVDVFSPEVVDEACVADPPSAGHCVGVRGTQAGCSTSCAGEDGLNLFFRTVAGKVEVFENPECGPTPVGGDWHECTSSGTVECDCLCEL